MSVRNLLIFLLFLCIQYDFSHGLYENCDITTSLAATDSRTFSYSFGSYSSCRYLFTAPSASIITLTCNLQIQTSSSCSAGSFCFDKYGNTSFDSSECSCSSGNGFSITSVFNSLVFAYIANSASGSYSCQVSSAPETSCDCGWTINQKIVGGTVTTPNEFPSVAALVDTTQNTVVCGSTIITYRYLLGAAHCMDVLQQGYISALVGDQDYTDGLDTPYAAMYVVSNVIVHSSYQETYSGYDIALYQTSTDITFNRGVGPACIPWNYANQNFQGYTVDVAGWGAQEFGGPPSTTLRKVTLNVVSNDICATDLQETMLSSQICTYTSGKDTCQNDSGGGLFLRYTRMFVVGIVSYGGACYGNMGSANTLVTSYLDWIWANTNNAYFCNKNIQ